MSIGFIGTGHITSAIIEGLSAAPHADDRFIVSPRNAEVARGLAARFARVEVAPDNQAVVDRSDMVFLAVRPPVAREVVAALRFRPAHVVVSLIALTPMDRLRPLVRPAGALVRAVLTPTCARRAGPVLYFHDELEPAASARVGAVLARLGVPVAVHDERAFHRLWSLTALVSPFYALEDAVAAWAGQAGVPRDTAALYAASFFQALATMVAPGEGEGQADLADRFAHLSRVAATPGGINEQAMGILGERGVFESLRAALDAVFERMEGGR
ncbi:MAG: NAD(P)-binding domain-containing protein [Alphaproteobacteria bacterium]